MVGVWCLVAGAGVRLGASVLDTILLANNFEIIKIQEVGPSDTENNQGQRALHGICKMLQHKVANKMKINGIERGGSLDQKGELPRH